MDFLFKVIALENNSLTCNNVNKMIANRLFSDWLIDELYEKGVTKQRIAEKAGIPSWKIRRILDGKVRPGSRCCKKLAQALDVPVRTVLTAAGLYHGAKTLQQENVDILPLFQNIADTSIEGLIRFA